jgi:hypothetical protein
MIKRKGGNQIGNLTPDHKSLESRSQMRFDCNVLYIIGKICSRAIRYYPCIIKKKYFEKYMGVQSFETTRVPVLGLPLGNPEEK